MKQIIYTLQTMPKLIEQCIQLLNHHPIIALEGSLGAGKTTLVKALLSALGVPAEQITSPTFSYVNRYQLPDGRWCHHFDLYRLASQDDFCQMGFQEYLEENGAISIIEWPEIIMPLLAEYGGKVAIVRLDYLDAESREAHIEIQV